MNPADTYKAHLGLFRFFASQRRLYDDLCNAKDQLKVQQAVFAKRESELRDMNVELTNRLLQKNGVRPIIDPVKATSAPHATPDNRPQPSFNPLDLMNERQLDSDTASHALSTLRQERENVENELFVKRAAEILNQNA